jgi:hypothetical protein
VESWFTGGVGRHPQKTNKRESEDRLIATLNPRADKPKGIMLVLREADASVKVLKARNFKPFYNKKDWLFYRPKELKTRQSSF